MDSVTIWHNPRCSKSREALSILEANGCEKDIVKYLDTNPNAATITNLLKMLGVTARELMRTKEDIYNELKLKDEHNEVKLIEAMALHPKLIERPILIKNAKAIIGRPTSVIVDFLQE